MATAITKENEVRQTVKYIIGDVIAAVLSWTVYYLFKIFVLEISQFSFDTKFFVSLSLYTAGWSFLHYLSGYYNSTFIKSRLNELVTTIITTLLGCIFLFFITVSNDEIEYNEINISITVLFLLQFSLTYIIRLCQTQKIAHMIHDRKIGFNTIIIGTGKHAKQTAQILNNMTLSTGYNIIGFIIYGDNNADELPAPVLMMDKENTLGKIARDNNVRNIIIATENLDNDLMTLLISELNDTDINIMISPADYDKLFIAPYHTTVLYSYPMVSILRSPMPDWQENVKNVADRVASFIALVLLMPFFLVVAIMIKAGSKGPVIYKQERLGLHAKPFTMYKFRSMYCDDNPEHSHVLTSNNDPRITKVGRLLRKYRIDELPQLFNVLIGQMSIVGPRPEQPYFANKLVLMSPDYALRYQVKPGLTSWGMVKYGYAENEEKMLERAKIEHIYLQNRSLAVDIKIILYTIRTIVTGKGV
ncbi:MAG: sugar transferase [Paludibacteraceae bacterium]|nr:sugar transferase [Paludibacteraceae bacterium]